MSGELLKAALTAVVGIFVFVLGQGVQRLLLEPIQEQRRVIGEIAFALLMYGNVDHVAQLEAEGRKVADIETPLNVVKKIRELAARLQQTLRVVPAYSILAKLRIVPATDDMILLIRELTTWSNSIYQGDPAPHRDAIARILRVRRHDDPPPLPRDGMIRSVRE